MSAIMIKHGYARISFVIPYKHTWFLLKKIKLWFELLVNQIPSLTALLWLYIFVDASSSLPTAYVEIAVSGGTVNLGKYSLLMVHDVYSNTPDTLEGVSSSRDFKSNQFKHVWCVYTRTCTPVYARINVIVRRYGTS